ncbi:MAG: Vitamin B12 import ATP-binding protein BtuD [Phycisphaerae bacterium]|nr:Vitamin B12 import ATP-binding protein BtuD [Phycisphaerae bacterium]
MLALELTNLRKTFVAPDGQRVPVVDVPEFRIDAAQQLALEGSSGSGKTTLLNLIAGILSPDSGRVLVAGIDLTGSSEPQRDRLRARHVGYVFQTFNLLQGYTALENVLLAMAFGRGVDRAYAGHLLERVGLGHRVHYRPRQLSIGQQQRVAVARALANHPTLVLADEPTGNLDLRHAHEALGLIRDICREQRAALLLVSHDRSVLAEFEVVRKMNSVNLAALTLAAQSAGGVA